MSCGTIVTRPSPSVFGYCKRSKTGAGEGLGTRLHLKGCLVTYGTGLASFPGPAQLSVACSTDKYCKRRKVLQATESWAGPGNEARTGLQDKVDRK